MCCADFTNTTYLLHKDTIFRKLNLYFGCRTEDLNFELCMNFVLAYCVINFNQSNSVSQIKCCIFRRWWKWFCCYVFVSPRACSLLRSKIKTSEISSIALKSWFQGVLDNPLLYLDISAYRPQKSMKEDKRDYIMTWLAKLRNCREREPETPANMWWPRVWRENPVNLQARQGQGTRQSPK